MTRTKISLSSSSSSSSSSLLLLSLVLNLPLILILFSSFIIAGHSFIFIPSPPHLLFLQSLSSSLLPSSPSPSPSPAPSSSLNFIHSTTTMPNTAISSIEKESTKKHKYPSFSSSSSSLSNSKHSNGNRCRTITRSISSRRRPHSELCSSTSSSLKKNCLHVMGNRDVDEFCDDDDDDDNEKEKEEDCNSIETGPLLSIGVIADIQYAPIPDGASYGGQPRYYRHALTTARYAAKHFEREKVSCVINLGDIIDGKCQELEKYGGVVIKNQEGVDGNGEEKKTQIIPLSLPDDNDDNDKKGNNNDDECSNNPGLVAMVDVLKALSTYIYGPIFHTYGNHELYNLDREKIGDMLNIPFVKETCGELVGYYSKAVPVVRRQHQGDYNRKWQSKRRRRQWNNENSNDNSNDNNSNSNIASSFSKNSNTKVSTIPTLTPTKRILFVFLDSYDIAIMNRCPTKSNKRRMAQDILRKHNPNEPIGESNSPAGLEGNLKRYVAFNGAVDGPQLEWLRCTLQQAAVNNDRAIIVSHQPILPGSSSPVCLVWNYDEILDILREFGSTVMASFCGHAHRGGYKQDEISGIHFRVFEAVLESADPVKTYAFVDIYDDRLVVRGLGDCSSAVYDLSHCN